jgi:hypothetical protein
MKDNIIIKSQADRSRFHYSKNAGPYVKYPPILLNGQLLKTYLAFKVAPSTMRMIELSTGILRPNICRYVARLKRHGMIQLVKRGHCPCTNHPAGFYTTKTVNRKSDKQLNLFF